MKIKQLLLIVFCLLGVAMSGRAQVTTSVLNGRVTDSDGSPLPGATVVAVHTPTGTSYGGVADAEGNYRLRNMRPGGPYTVTFSYLGYATIERGGINLVVADSRALNVSMESDTNVIEGVVVVAADLYKATSGSGSVTEITTRDINLMPTTSRSLSNLLTLTPQSNGESIGGGSHRQNYITIDGGSFNNMFGIGAGIPSGGSPVSMDAIEQMSVNITPYDVRQSGFLGAAVNAVTRSGSNEFEGSAYTYFKSEKFRGRRVGDQRLTRGTKDRYNLYGARLGGPIIKDKLFFFGSVEIEKNIEAGPIRRTSTDGVANSALNIARPTDAEMQTISNFLRDNYGYETGPWQDYSYDLPALRILGRIDWNINRNHKFTARYSNITSKYVSSPSTSTSGTSFGSSDIYPGGGNRGDMNAMWFKNSAYYQHQNYTSIAAELNSSLADSRIFNTLRVTYSDQNEPRSTNGGEFPAVDILKGGTVLTSFGTEVFSHGNLRRVKQITVTDDASWTWGRHNMTAGLQYEHTNTLNGFQRFGTGWYVFDSWDAFANQQNPRMYAITASTNPGYAQNFPSFNFNQFTAYLQDEFTVSDRFSLTAGVRFDLPTYPSKNEIMTHPLIASLDYLGMDGKGGQRYDTGVMPKARVMFSPRVGFNYDILGNQALILRGGTGIFTGRIPFVWIVAQSGDAGMLQLTQNWRGTDVPGPFNPDPLHYLPETPVQPGTTIPTGGFTVMDPEFKMPQAWKTSIALDARLPWGMKGTLETIYNKNINEVYIYKDGLVPPTALNVAGYPDHRLMYSYDYGKRYQYMLNSSGMPITTAIPNGTYGAQAQVVTNAPLKWGGYYASVTAKIEKPLDHGFSGMIAYTHSWARNFTDGNSDQAYSVWSNRPTVNGGNSKEMGYASYVMPHNVVASFSYNIEYAKSMGTTVSLLYTGGTSGRFNYLYTRNIVNDGGGVNLIYVPKDASEIDFVDYTYREGNQYIVPEGWTAQEQEDAFFAYIEQDKYLRSRKGKYAERGAALRPWESRFDVKIVQDFYVKTRSGKRNTLQLSIDVINFANLLNPHWGVGNAINLANQYGEVQLLNLTNASAVANGARPTFTLNPLVGTSGKNAVKPTTTFRDSFSYGDTFSFQIGLRYLFN